MKKTVSAFTAAFLAMAVLIGGCAQKTEDIPEEPSEGTETVVGGWEPYADYVQIIGEDEKAIFEKATEKLLGVNYTPVQVIATQIVSGTNYAYLAATETVTKEPKKGFAIVTVYADLSGNAEVLAVNELDVSEIRGSDNIDDPNLLGGWKVTDTGKVAGLSEAGESAFVKAMEGFTGVGLKPIVLLGTQLVSGTNYRFLCRGTTVTENPVTSLYITTVYEDLEGNCRITENRVFDLVSYVTPAE